MNDKSETTLVEDPAAPKRDPATVAHEQRFGGASPASDGAAVAKPGSDESNSGIHMRPGHRLLTDKEVALLQEIDFLEGELQQRFNDVMPELKSGEQARCIALAKTNLQQAVMWATKAITQ